MARCVKSGPSFTPIYLGHPIPPASTFPLRLHVLKLEEGGNPHKAQGNHWHAQAAAHTTASSCGLHYPVHCDDLVRHVQDADSHHDNRIAASIGINITKVQTAISISAGLAGVDLCCYAHNPDHPDRAAQELGYNMSHHDSCMWSWALRLIRGSPVIATVIWHLLPDAQR